MSVESFGPVPDKEPTKDAKNKRAKLLASWMAKKGPELIEDTKAEGGVQEVKDIRFKSVLKAVVDEGGETEEQKNIQSETREQNDDDSAAAVVPAVAPDDELILPETEEDLQPYAGILNVIHEEPVSEAPAPSTYQELHDLPPVILPGEVVLKPAEEPTDEDQEPDAELHEVDLKAEVTASIIENREAVSLDAEDAAWKPEDNYEADEEDEVVPTEAVRSNRRRTYISHTPKTVATEDERVSGAPTERPSTKLRRERYIPHVPSSSLEVAPEQDGYILDRSNAAEAVRQRVAEAAEQGEAIEKQFEMRHEAKDSDKAIPTAEVLDDDKPKESGAESLGEILAARAKQSAVVAETPKYVPAPHVTLPRPIEPSEHMVGLSAEANNPFKKPSRPAAELYRQAVINGFWGGVIVAAIMALVYLFG